MEMTIDPHIAGQPTDSAEMGSKENTNTNCLAPAHCDIANHSANEDYIHAHNTGKYCDPLYMSVGALAFKGATKVELRLLDSQLWTCFHMAVNEMIVTRDGRRMFPVLRFDVTGLEPNDMYNFELDFVLVDQHRFKFINGEWIRGSRADIHKFSRTYIHPDSPNYGKFWMDSSVAFSRTKITNKDESDSTKIFLNSMHKYIPRVHIKRIESDKSHSYIGTYSFTETEFIAVTAYQNDSVTTLKVRYNPFAKAFLEPRLNSNCNGSGSGCTEEPRIHSNSLDCLHSNGYTEKPLNSETDSCMLRRHNGGNLPIHQQAALDRVTPAYHSYPPGSLPSSYLPSCGGSIGEPRWGMSPYYPYSPYLTSYHYNSATQLRSISPHYYSPTPDPYHPNGYAYPGYPPPLTNTPLVPHEFGFQPQLPPYDRPKEDTKNDPSAQLNMLADLAIHSNPRDDASITGNLPPNCGNSAIK